MTGYTVHTGSSVKFSTSWDRIFENARAGKKSTATQSGKAVNAGKSAKTAAVKSIKKGVKKAAPVKSTKKKTAKSVKRGK